jgi:hypothetical protein
MFIFVCFHFYFVIRCFFLIKRPPLPYPNVLRPYFFVVTDFVMFFHMFVVLAFILQFGVFIFFLYVQILSKCVSSMFCSFSLLLIL